MGAEVLSHWIQGAFITPAVSLGFMRLGCQAREREREGERERPRMEPPAKHVLQLHRPAAHLHTHIIQTHTHTHSLQTHKYNITSPIIYMHAHKCMHIYTHGDACMHMENA